MRRNDWNTRAGSRDRQRIDLLVIGGGPAGIACANQAARDGLRIKLVGDEPLGGLVRAARRLDNYAPAPGISGEALADGLAAGFERQRIPWQPGRVAALDHGPTGFRARLQDGSPIVARAVCLATGTWPRAWTLLSKDGPCHREARTLPARLDGAEVLVVGGGEVAFDTALSASDRGGRVTLLSRREPRVAPGLLCEARERGVRLKTGEVERVDGRPGSWCLRTSGGGTASCAHLVVCIGREPRDELVPGAGSRGGAKPRGAEPTLPVAGLFLAGDLVRQRQRYVSLALADGQAAALAAGRFLRGAEP